MSRRLAFFCLVLTLPVLAQLPPSAKLSEHDQPLFDAEIGRIQKALTTAPDQAALTFLLARTYASAKQWPQAIETLRKLVDLKTGIDPSRDSMFAEIKSTHEFQEISGAVTQSTPPVTHSKKDFEIAEGDLMPESMAYDSKSKSFFFGSITKGKVLRCSAAGQCGTFAAGLHTVLGMKVFGDSLWLLDNSDRESAIIRFELSTGKETRRYRLPQAGHQFNDLAIAPNGAIYITDTRAAALWVLVSPFADLEPMNGRFELANGIAISSDGKLLYVSTFPDGITIVDLVKHTTTPIARPAGLCLSMIDGLYFHHGDLIAIQNGFMNPRVVRMELTHNQRGVAKLEVLERRNPVFDGLTTGVVYDGYLYYMANIQDEKKSGFAPITILKLSI